jgi:hypothetical protein
MNLTETIKNMKQNIDEAAQVGGGTTGVSMATDPTNVRAKAPGNSKTQGDMKVINPIAGDEEETDPENNTAPTNTSADKNRATIAAKGTGMKEHIVSMFDGEDLSEEFKERAGTLFEVAVNQRVAELQEEFEVVLAEQIQKMEEEASVQLEELVAKLDDYLSYVAGQWIAENELAVETGLKAEITEGFIEGLRNLFAENYIDVPDERFDVVEELAARVQELEGQLNEAVNENIQLASSITEMTAEETFNEVAEGLASTQVEKFKHLAEGIEFDDVSNFKKKLNIIKENYFSTGVVEKRTSGLLEESFEGEEAPQNYGPMAHYMKAISRNIVK